MMKPYSVPRQITPCCGEIFEYSMSAQGTAPKPGDFIVCMYCASILNYDERLRTRLSPFDTIPAELLTVQKKALSSVKSH